MSTVTLRSNDGEELVVDIRAAKCSTVISQKLEGSEALDGNIIPLPNVDGKTLKKVITWANHHKNDPPVNPNRSDETSAWDDRFMRKLDKNTLFDVVKAANYLEIPVLLHLTAKKVAGLIAGKSPAEIRAVFGMKVPASYSQIKMLGDANESTPHVKVESSEGRLLGIDVETAKLIPLIRSLMRERSYEDGTQQHISLPNAFSSILEKLVEWVEHHKKANKNPISAPSNKPEDKKGDGDSKNTKSEWENTFINEFDLGTLFELVALASDMGVESLVDPIRKQIASMWVGKNSEELREILNSKNALSAQEMELIQKYVQKFSRR